MTINMACGVHGPIPCDGAGCICGKGTPPSAAPAVQTELTEHRINELAWETFKSDPRTLFATRCQEFARSIEREIRSLLSGTRTCVQAPSDGGQSNG